MKDLQGKTIEITTEKEVITGKVTAHMGGALVQIDGKVTVDLGGESVREFRVLSYTEKLLRKIK